MFVCMRQGGGAALVLETLPIKLCGFQTEALCWSWQIYTFSIISNTKTTGLESHSFLTHCHKHARSASPVGSNTAGKVKPWRSPAPCAATMAIVAGKRTRSSRVGRGNISQTIRDFVQVKSVGKWFERKSPPSVSQWAKCVNRPVLLFTVAASQRDVILMILWRKSDLEGENCCANRDLKKTKKTKNRSRDVRRRSVRKSALKKKKKFMFT